MKYVGLSHCNQYFFAFCAAGHPENPGMRTHPGQKAGPKAHRLTRKMSGALQRERHAHATANAQSRQALARIAALHFMQQRDQDAAP